MDPQQQAQHYSCTPSVHVFDSGGRTVREIQTNRRAANEAIQTLITAHCYNVLEQLVSSLDPRLFDLQAQKALVQPTWQQISSLNGQVLYTEHVDTGLRLQLYHAQQPLIWSYDSRKTEHAWEYDSLARPLAFWEKSADIQRPQCRERFYYGDNAEVISDEKAKQANLKGQLYQHDNTAGRKRFLAYDINQHAIAEAQQFLKNTTQDPHWSDNSALNEALLETETYANYAYYTALSDLATQINAKHYQQTFEYNSLGQIKKTFFNFPNETTPQPLLIDCQYHSSGQLLREKLVNGVSIHREYEPYTQRLIRLKTQRPTECLQDLHYDYDPVGNITCISDKTQTPVFHNNQKVEAKNEYEYDALYQLISASGRENSNNKSENNALFELQSLTNPDKTHLTAYQRTYRYDKAGNMLKIQHQGRHSYSVVMQIDSRSNRSLQKTAQQDNLIPSFDANGNSLYLKTEQLAPFSWNYRNQLQKTVALHREDNSDDSETYLYDGQGQRQQKQRHWLTQNQLHTERVRYLAQLELREKWQKNTDDSSKKHNETLYLIPLSAGSVSVRLLHWEIGKPDTIENNQQRFSIDNHLGSSQLEMDLKAQILSYEEYFPYGGTAVWACCNCQEAAYKYVRYSGKERDHSGLYYYGARYYIPWLGRWLNPDPAGISDGLNLFHMVHNNPIKLLDTAGFEAASFQSYSHNIAWQTENIGDFRLYRSGSNNPKKALLIYAHGAYMLHDKNSRSINKNMSIHFLAEHGLSLETSPEQLPGNYTSSVETVNMNNKVTNYKLGTVGKQDITSLIESFEYQKRLDPNKEIPDILIVQETKMLPTTLNKALKIAENEGYSDVHGAFCRGLTLRPLPLFIRKPLQEYLSKRRKKQAAKKEKERNQARIQEDCLRERQERLQSKQKDNFSD